MSAALAGTAPTLLQTLRGHGPSGEITCCDVSSAGDRLLTAGGDRALRLWRWQAGGGWEPAAAAQRAHRYGVTVARWSPAGALVASGGVDGAARVWAGGGLAPRRLLAAPGAPALRALCWAGAGRLLCGHDDGTVFMWHVPRGAPLARLHAHEGALHALASLARGALLLAACTDGVLKVFDLQEVCRCGSQGEAEPAPLLWVDGAHDLGALCCAAGGEGDVAATGGHDARIRLWHVEGGGGGRVVRAGAALEGHGAAVTALSWAGGVLASAALDRTARLWAATGSCLAVLHAHERYLTCVVLAPDLRYMVTGSNDKSIRMWALGNLTIDDSIETPCDPLAHFGIGDLEGIQPLDDDLLLAEVAGVATHDGGAARQAWRSLEAHAGAVNCIAVQGDKLATACSDGVLRVWRWSDGELSLEVSLGARGYPLLAADWGAGGVLLAAGMDGAAKLWDVESGCVLRSLSLPAAEGENGGAGGARGARVSRSLPARLLLAADDGRVPLWALDDADPKPTHVYYGGGHATAATCCAWSGCARVYAAGGEGGELRLHAAPPRLAQLLHYTDAHDLGVQSCDFADSEAVGMEDGELLMASAGNDDLIKLWRIELDEEDDTVTGARMSLLCSVTAHGGGAASVRWRGGRLASGGADGWARVWGLRGEGGEGGRRLAQLAAVPARAAAGVPAAVLLDDNLLALGSLSGELSVWRLPAGAGEEEEAGEGEGKGEEEGGEADDDVGAEPRWWGGAGVARWLRDYVTRVPGEKMSGELESKILLAARAAGVTGARLLDAPLDELLEELGYDEESESDPELAAVRARLQAELVWLRRSPPQEHLAGAAPHALLCPVSHGLLRSPARAADGITYDRCALHEWFIAADGFVSFVSGRRLPNGRVRPNRGARDALRAFLDQHSQEPPPLDDSDVLIEL